MQVRLKQFEIDAIIDAFKHNFDCDDKLWLFGSRADLSKRGGDIDLYVETKLNAELAVDARLNFVIMICDRIGEQKIDVVLNLLSGTTELPIYELAKTEGVQLV